METRTDLADILFELQGTPSAGTSSYAEYSTDTAPNAERLVPTYTRSQQQSTAQVQAVYQRPVKEVQNVFGARNRVDYSGTGDMRPTSYGPRFQQSYSEQLPSAGQSVRYSYDQMVPEPTRITRVCMNKTFESVPFYERSFPIVDAFPVKPTMGEIGDDPRYKMISTKTNTSEYKQVCEDNQGQVPLYKTVTPNFGLFN